MTNEEIKNYSRLCAEFLGFEISENKECFKLPNKNGWIVLDIFHSDWNWIMEVVNSIKNTKNPKEHSDTTFSTLRREIQTHLGRANKEAVVKAINQFLIWYNETKL